jgi:hypothetical protein
MARAVNSTLGEIIEQQRGLKEGGGDEVVKMLRASNMYDLDRFFANVSGT